MPAFFRPDKFELLSSDVDNDPPLDPLEIDGDRTDAKGTFPTAFLTTELLPVLSSDVEETLLVDKTEGGDGLMGVFLSCLLASEDGEVLEVLATGDTGIDFLISEMLVLFMGVVPVEGNELLRISGRDLLTDSEELVFLAATGVTPLSCRLVSDIGCFSGTPPVLFLLITGTEPELREALAIVDFVNVDRIPAELAIEPLWTSVFLFGIPVAVVPFGSVEPFGLAFFGALLTLSVDDGFRDSDS